MPTISGRRTFSMCIRRSSRPRAWNDRLAGRSTPESGPGRAVMGHADSGFVGSIPQLYERYMVPLMFESYAADLAARARRRNPARVLEVAAGTGVVTRHLAKVLPVNASIVATDLNQPM